MRMKILTVSDASQRTTFLSRTVEGIARHCDHQGSSRIEAALRVILMHQLGKHGKTARFHLDVTTMIGLYSGPLRMDQTMDHVT